MEKTKAIISANLVSFKEFEYYFSIIEIAEESIHKKPDVTIDCCKSLIEGVSKSILIRLDNNYAENTELVDRPSAIKLFNKAIKLIAKFDKSFVGKETDILQKSKDLVDTIINIRNDRGDISHGKFAPKPDEIISTSEFAVFVISLTDSIISFMLKILFQIDIPKASRLDYEDEEMKAYNNWLDENTEFPIKKAKYSQLLFENDYDEYESRYSDGFIKTDEEETEKEEVVEVQPEEKGEVKIQKELSFEDWFQVQLRKPSKLSPKASEKLYQEHFGDTDTTNKKPVVLVNSFKEDTFWTDKRNNELVKFACTHNLKRQELKEFINRYYFTEKEPGRDEVGKIMKFRPSLKDRRTELLVLLEFIIEFADSLKTVEGKL
jgi:hypothetical protein